MMKDKINFKNIFKLQNAIQHYAWGSTTCIPEFLGIKNEEGKPFAELWIGSHLKAPSFIILSTNESISLRDFISADAGAVLGKNVVKDFGADLPFLFKVLAAASPLSIQAHPSKQQALQGFTKEEISCIPLNAPNRNYKDTNCKSELLVALSPFQALAGFKPFAVIIKEFNSFSGNGTLSSIVNNAGQQAPEKRIYSFLAQLLCLQGKDKEIVISEIMNRIKEREGAAYNWVKKLYSLYPTDLNVLSPLFLNMIELKTGQAVFLPSGVLHLYLEGFGLEIMTNSDNVIRGGLTPKYIDVAELLRILDFKANKPEIITPQKLSAFEYTTSQTMKEFQLARIILNKGNNFQQGKRDSIEILLIRRGDLNISSSCLKKPITARMGESFLMPAVLPDYTIQGQGECYLACVNI